MEAVKDCEENLKRTKSFRNQQGSLFKYVKKVGPNIRTQINTLKHQALGIKRGSAKMCRGRGCKTCNMLIKDQTIRINNKKIRLSEGTCKTGNVCYIARCKICNKPYSGRTVELIHKRVNGHRASYKEVLKSAATNTLNELDTSGDLFVLGLHLFHDHGLDDPSAFDRNMEFGILEVTNPSQIERKEYTWMHQLNTFQPIGLNIEYPFGIPFLGQNS